MDQLYHFTLLWLALDLFYIGTIWYAAATLPRLWPNWWRRVIVDTAGPEFHR